MSATYWTWSPFGNNGWRSDRATPGIDRGGSGESADPQSEPQRCAAGGVVAQFRQARAELVRQLEAAPEDVLGFAAMHPRLKTLMNVVDVAFFVAEHDDYHLARIRELLREVT